MPEVEEDRMSGEKRDGLVRVCFRMQLKPERIADYLEAHQTVWPEMLDALRETGWHDYSLFIDREDGLIIGVLETEDYERAQAEMGRKDVNARWQATMADFFVGSENPDSSSRQLEEYFHLA